MFEIREIFKLLFWHRFQSWNLLRQYVSTTFIEQSKIQK